MFKNDNVDQEVWISINFNPLRFHVFMGNLMIHQSQKPTPTSVSFQRHSQVIYSDDKLNRTVWVFPLRNVIRNIPPVPLMVDEHRCESAAVFRCVGVWSSGPCVTIGKL